VLSIYLFIYLLLLLLLLLLLFSNDAIQVYFILSD